MVRNENGRGIATTRVSLTALLQYCYFRMCKMKDHWVQRTPAIANKSFLIHPELAFILVWRRSLVHQR